VSVSSGRLSVVTKRNREEDANDSHPASDDDSEESCKACCSVPGDVLVQAIGDQPVHCDGAEMIVRKPNQQPNPNSKRQKRKRLRLEKEMSLKVCGFVLFLFLDE